ncbi:DUF4962 domain-containing protein [Dysgonomonas sp. OttesenSCG-928-M03]|nr:DUF4962 domain-containing protein [Dysgonomonas sp. OttesenSCG-928-M03]
MLRRAVVLFMFAIVLVITTKAQNSNIEKDIDKRAIHPRYREWATPANGKEVSTNPTALLWPAAEGKNVVYKVRLSQDKNFPVHKTVVSKDLEWAMFNNHKKMDIGRWYWQYGVVKGNNVEWSDIYDFVIKENTPVFETPTIDEFLTACSMKHPRLYVSEDEMTDFRTRNLNNAEALQVIKKANKQLTAPLPAEEPTRPRDTTNLTVSQKNVMMTFMYHRFGDKVKEPVKNLSMAYLLTGDNKYARTALKQALHIAQMNPEGYATKEDFNAASVMLAMSAAFDAAYGYATPEDKEKLLQAIKVRGNKFYKKYKNEFETHSMDNHVWQHTLRRLCFSSIAVLNDLPEATKWLAYCYEVWCCRFPILGANDGGWHDGTSYFQVNFETFIYIPFMFKRLTGKDFFDLPYYHNLSKFLIYSYPKNSYSTGFGDNAENQKKPGKSYWGFADALARELHDPYARWYADEISEGKKEIVSESANFAFYRLMTKNRAEDVRPKSPQDLPQSQLFRDAGFALMHDDVTDTPNDIMLSFAALPFGSTGHAHAAHNGFGINVGGKQMFGGSGHYSNFTDKHTLKHYRTRGHNTILADGMAQVIGENGYGWIARFRDTPALTYVLGDATHAYGKMTTPFWINRMKQFEVDYTKENGFGDPGITRFRRHFVFLRPDIVIIYDELEAKAPVEWTWLLHSYNKMRKGESENVVLGENEVANSRVDVFNRLNLSSHITNEFFSPAINWKSRGNADKPYEYSKHWHLELSTKTKSSETRFLSIIQIDREKGDKILFAPQIIKEGSWKVGDWTIRAEMDGKKRPSLIIKNSVGNGIEYIDQGRTIIKEHNIIIDQLSDVLPESAN